MNDWTYSFVLDLHIQFFFVFFYLEIQQKNCYKNLLINDNSTTLLKLFSCSYLCLSFNISVLSLYITVNKDQYKLWA